MKRLTLFAIVAAALLPFASACAEEKVTLNLRVLDAETGDPVAGYRALAIDSFGLAGLSGKSEKQWTGDAQGLVTVEFNLETARGYERRVQVHHPDYVPFEKVWGYYPQRQAPILEVFPAEYTARLERGVTIGGIVKDHDEKPLPDVRVYPLRQGYSLGDAPEWSPAWMLNYTFDGASNAVHATTDSSGRWELDRFPSGFDNVAFAVVRPGHSFVPIYTAQDRFLGRSGQVVPLPDFLARQAEIILPRGHTIRGLVTDADGEPIPGAVLSETHGRSIGIVARTVTDADGRFALLHRLAKEIVLVARAPGRALLATNIPVEPDLPEIRLVLRQQQGITGRVVDGDGKPIAEARAVNLSAGHFEWEGTMTDADGRFRWEEGPFEPTDLLIIPTNSSIVRKLTVQAGEPEKLIVIRPDHAEFIRLTGTVVDSATGEPVKQFTLASAGSSQGPDIFNFKAEGRDGQFELQLPRTAWRDNHLPAGELQAMADGFVTQPIGPIHFWEGDRELRVLLKRGASELAGVVLTPDGAPAEGAGMELARGLSSTFLNRPGQFQSLGRDSERFITGADGKYSFAADQRNKSLVITHASGFAAGWASNWIGAASIQLEPWARISGVAMESGRPLANQNVTLRSPSGPFRTESFGISYTTITDSEGRFSFALVPAGRFLLSRRFPPPAGRGGPMVVHYTHAQPVSVRAGEEKEVIYGGDGRTVIGMAQADPPGLAVNWQRDRHTLAPVRSKPAPARPHGMDYASQETFLAALRRFEESGRENPLEQERGYQLQFDSDGRFEISDVPPGKYELIINLLEEQSDRQMMMGYGKSIGSVRQIVLVAEGPLDQPVDIGNVPVKITATLPQAKPLPPFEALTLDGGPLRAAEWRGKHVALVFWAGWCRASEEAIPDLRRIYSDFQANPGFAMIGVSLDETADMARHQAGRLALEWAGGWLDEPGRLRLIETYGVTGTPTIFLLDPAGNIAARDLKPASLRAALDRALGAGRMDGPHAPEPLAGSAR